MLGTQHVRPGLGLLVDNDAASSEHDDRPKLESWLLEIDPQAWEDYLADRNPS